MKLSFYAREDLLVSTHHPRYVGQPARRVGREYVAPGMGVYPGASFPATKEPYVIDDESKDPAIAAGATDAVRACQLGDLWAADQATADRCGVALVPVEFKDGEWTRKASAPIARPIARTESGQA